MILIVSSRRPAQRTRSLVKDLNRVIPNSARMNRGKKSIKDLQKIAVGMGYDRIMLIGSKGGEPSTIRFLRVFPDGFEYIDGWLKIIHVTLRREITKKRAPAMNSLCIFNVAGERGYDVARYLQEGLNIDMFRNVSSLDEVSKYYDECDCALLILLLEKGFMIDFFHVEPFFELGPRIKVDLIE